jgi:hypothetical protein
MIKKNMIKNKKKNFKIKDNVIIVILIILYIYFLYNTNILFCEGSEDSSFKMFDLAEGNSNFTNNEFHISQSNPNFTTHNYYYSYDMLNISLSIVTISSMLIMAITTKSFN